MQACDLLAETEHLGIGSALGPLPNRTSPHGSKKSNVNGEGIS